MRLWLDDLRPAPDGWDQAFNSAQAIEMVATGEVTHMSLDHDLGGDDTSRRVVLWMCENEVWPDVIYVHTANPVGRDWLVSMVNRYGPGVSRWR